MNYQETTTRNEWSGPNGHGSQGNLLVCQGCGAVVARESADLHDKWHEPASAGGTRVVDHT